MKFTNECMMCAHKYFLVKINVYKGVGWLG